MHDVIIDESNLVKNYRALRSYCSKLEFRYARYLDILRRMRLKVVVSGELADALDAYIARASALKGQFDNIANDFEELSKSYIREIDDVDDF